LSEEITFSVRETSLIHHTLLGSTLPILGVATAVLEQLGAQNHGSYLEEASLAW
jgi:hypothetical protein